MNKILKKIIKKFLLFLPISKVDWVIKKILEFYGIIQVVQIKHELKMPNKKPMNFRHYLPNTEQRIEKLAKLINKRPVAIVLPGYSVKELEQRIEELSYYDICYASVNDFWAIEKYILQKINCNLSLAISGIHAKEEINNIVNFLERPDDNMFFSTKQAFQRFNLNKLIEKYDEKLLFTNGVDAPFVLTLWGGLFPQIPSREYPLHFPGQNTLSILLFLALIGGTSKVIIFGGDGGRINNQGLFFREADSENRHFDSDYRIMADTEVFNAAMPLMLKKIYKTYNIKSVDIINCSELSYYTPFRKLSYDKTFALLKQRSLAPLIKKWKKIKK